MLLTCGRSSKVPKRTYMRPSPRSQPELDGASSPLPFVSQAQAEADQLRGEKGALKAAKEAMAREKERATAQSRILAEDT